LFWFNPTKYIFMDEMPIIIDKNAFIEDEHLLTLCCAIINIQKSIVRED
jgi:hypothetical protein